MKTALWKCDRKEFKDFIMDFPKIIDDADKAVARKRKSDIEAILVRLIEDTKKIIKNRANYFDDRLFRAYIWRIVKCHWYKNVKKGKLDYIGNSCIKLLDEMPGRTDSIIRFLILHKDKKYVQEGIEKILKASVYPWQKMQLWRLLILVDKIKNPNLLQLARTFVRDYSKSENARNYALIFLGKHGEYSDRQCIAQLYKHANKVFTQRCILIAIQEYPDKNIIYNRIISSANELWLKSLVEYLRNLERPEYIDYDRRTGEDQVVAS